MRGRVGAAAPNGTRLHPWLLPVHAPTRADAQSHSFDRFRGANEPRLATNPAVRKRATDPL